MDDLTPTGDAPLPPLSVPEAAALLQAAQAQLQRSLLGQEEVVDSLLIAILAGGHVLLEGLPGLGKTLLVRSLGQGLGLSFSRMQFTPDMLPTDGTGTPSLYEPDGEPSIRLPPGSVAGGSVPADENKRPTPQHHSAAR